MQQSRFGCIVRDKRTAVLFAFKNLKYNTKCLLAGTTEY